MSKGFVVYKDADGWFRWTTAEWWDDPQHIKGAKVEIGRHPTLNEARNVRHAYNMMVHSKPTPNDVYNKMLERKGELQ